MQILVPFELNKFHHENKKGDLMGRFSKNADKLINRTKQGATRDLVQDLVDQSHQDQWDNWYRRILIKISDVVLRKRQLISKV